MRKGAQQRTPPGVHENGHPIAEQNRFILNGLFAGRGGVCKIVREGQTVNRKRRRAAAFQDAIALRLTLSNFRKVLECASPLALFPGGRNAINHERGLKTYVFSYERRACRIMSDQPGLSGQNRDIFFGLRLLGRANLPLRPNGRAKLLLCPTGSRLGGNVESRL